MKIFLASEFRCTIYKNEYYLAPKAYTIYKRYADAFDELVLCSRFESVQELKTGYKKAHFITDTIHIDNLSKTLWGLNNNIIEKGMNECDLVIVRVPSIIAYRTADCARKLGKPYMTESMGDAWDGYWNHDILGKIIAPYMMMKMKDIVSKANYALYVTEQFLQKDIPVKNKNINASNVVIDELDLSVLEKRKFKISEMDKKSISLMTAAGVDTHAKGHMFVIRAMKKLHEKGYQVRYYLAGGGDQTRLQKIAKNNGVEDHVIFLGELPMNEVYRYIDQVDIYIQPSLQEGLPRAVIEAMSRACPCLGSNTAGTPELLDGECIFRRKSSNAIAKKIIWFLEQDLMEYAERNFNHSNQYTNGVLSKRRNEYFVYVRQDVEKISIKKLEK